MQEDRPLSLDEYKRYGRQMIMPNWGLSGMSHSRQTNDQRYARYASAVVLSQKLTGSGQLKVKTAKIAVVGAGGLGCPLLQYLAGAGVGMSLRPESMRLPNTQALSA